MLGGDHNGFDGARNDAVIADGHLGLAVGAQVIELPALAHEREPFGQTVGDPDRDRHEFGRFPGGIAEHDALVTGTLPVEVVKAGLLACFESVVHALGDVG